MNHFSRLLFAGIALTSLAITSLTGCSSGGGESSREAPASVVAAKPDTCDYGNKTYSSGEQFSSTDSCNGCLCDDGEVICTNRACAKVVTCRYEGQSYAPGDSFPVDGCNHCTCQASGEIVCTQRDCAPVDEDASTSAQPTARRAHDRG